MDGKVFAGVIMGVIVAIFSLMVFGAGSGGGESGGKIGLWAALIGFAVTLVLAVRAATGRNAWGRGLLLAGLLCFALPLESIIFSGVQGAARFGSAPTVAGKAGAIAGIVLAGGFLTIVSGVVSFFLGLIFLMGSYFSLRAQ